MILVGLLIFIIVVLLIIIVTNKKDKDNEALEEIKTEIEKYFPPLEDGTLNMDETASQVKQELYEDTLDLNDLFNTISIKAIKNDDNFNFELRRANKS